MKENNPSKTRELIRSHFSPFLLLLSAVSLTSIAINLIPIANSSRFRNECIISAKKSLKYKNPDASEYGIDLDELASIEGYRFCIQSG